MFHLPVELCDLIYEMAGHREEWKIRFSNDVLSQINKGHRLVGMFCRHHGDDHCGCNELVPCANCYCYGNEICTHRSYEAVPYKQIVEHCSLTSKYTPMEVFMYYCVSNLDIVSMYLTPDNKFATFMAFHAELEETLVPKE